MGPKLIKEMSDNVDEKNRRISLKLKLGTGPSRFVAT